MEKGFYDHACFFAEQYVQLYIKAILYGVLGTYPRTHGIRELLSILLRILPEDKARGLSDYIRANRPRVSELEDAYIMARYTAKTYTRIDAEEILSFTRELVEKIKEALGGEQWL